MNHRTAFDRYTIPNRAHLNISSKQYSFQYRCFFTSAPDPQAEGRFRFCEMAHVMPFRCIYLQKNSISESIFKAQTRCSAAGLSFLHFLHAFLSVICKIEMMSLQACAGSASPSLAFSLSIGRRCLNLLRRMRARPLVIARSSAPRQSALLRV